MGFDTTASCPGSASITLASTTYGSPVGAMATTAITQTASGQNTPGLAACPAAQPLLRLWNICTQSNTPIPDLSGVSKSERLDQLTKAVLDNNLGRIAALILAGAPLRPQAMSGILDTRYPGRYITSTSILPLLMAIKKARIDALDVLLLHPAAAAEKMDEGHLIAATSVVGVRSSDWAKLIRKMLTEGFAVEQRGQFPVIDSALGSYMFRTGGEPESIEDFKLFLGAGANPNIWIIDHDDDDDVDGQSLPDYLQMKFEIAEEDSGSEERLAIISTCLKLVIDAGCIVHDRGAMEKACRTNNIALLEKQLRFDLRNETAREKFPQTVDTMDPDRFPDPVIRDLLNHRDTTREIWAFDDIDYPFRLTYRTVFSDTNLSAQEYKNELICAMAECSICSGLMLAVADLLGTENNLLDAIALKGGAPFNAQIYECVIHLFEGLANDPILSTKANAIYVKSGLSVSTQKNLAILMQRQAMEAASSLRWEMRDSSNDSLLISDMKNFLARCLYFSQPSIYENVNLDATKALRAFLVGAGFFEPLVLRIVAAWASVSQPRTDMMSLLIQNGEISDESFINTEAGEKLANQFGQALLEQFALDKPSVLVPPAGSGADRDAFAVIMQPQYELVTGYARGAAEFKRAS